MRLIGLAIVLAVSLVLAPLAADAQQAGRVYRIGWLSINAPSAGIECPESFLKELHRLGWVEGRDFSVIYRRADGRRELLPQLAKQLVDLHVDIIVAPVTDTTLAAKEATNTIPILTAMPGDPIGTGLVRSLARPGGNVTGTTMIAGVEQITKHFEFLKEALPKASRIAVIFHPDNASHPPQMRYVEAAARPLGIRLQPVGVRVPEEFNAAFSSMGREKADGFLILGDQIFWAHRVRVAELALTHRLAGMFTMPGAAQAGGLLQYTPDVWGLCGRVAYHADRILRGAKPADLPMEQPTKFQLVINLKTAKALGLTIPQSILLQADHVIE